MNNLNALKKDLDSTKNLKVITDAMKTLSATNIKKYEKATMNLLRYIDILNLGFQAVLQKYPKIVDFFGYFNNDNRTDKLTLSIVIGSNQGLCGKFNDRIVDLFDNYFKNSKEQHFIITVGDRLNSIIKTKNIDINAHFPLPASLNSIGELVYNILSITDDIIKNDRFKKVRVYYTKYDTKNVFGVLTRKKLLPLDKQYFTNLIKKEWPTYQMPLWNVSTKQLFLDLTKQYLLANLSSMVVSSMTAEQKSRLFTLQSAEKNINEHINDLTLLFNQTRQNIITSNLIDTVSGFRNLNQQKKKSNE